ncbi:MAG TPA: hypothetical protein VES62_07755 [Thermoleophilaceae bacterium]|nr:hypothetical protein [Thermoleophilaceae bacterium]
MLGRDPTNYPTVDLAVLAERVHSFDSFGRTLAGLMLRAASKAEVGSEVSVPIDATVQIRSTPDGGLVIVGCICVTGEGCPCVDFGDLLPPRIPPWPVPTWPGTTGPFVPFSAHDHTEIIAWLMANTMPVLVQLGMSGPRRSRITPTEVLEAMTRVEHLDPSLRDRVKAALANARVVERVQLPPEARSAVDDVTSRVLKERSVEGMIKVLTELSKRVENERIPGLLEGIRTATAILQDGLSTIYNPDSSYSVVAKSAGEDAADVGKADAVGAVEGAVAGAVGGVLVAGPVGAGTLAAAGGAAWGLGSSAGKVVEKVWDWLWS